MTWIGQYYDESFHVVPTHDLDCQHHVLHWGCWCLPDAEYNEDSYPMYTHRDRLDREIDTSWTKQMDHN